MIEIYDDFLSDTAYHSLCEGMSNHKFPWFLGEAMTYGERPDTPVSIFNKESSLLYHMFWYAPSRTKSTYFNFLGRHFPFVHNQDLFLIRANLILPTKFDIRHTPYHHDVNNYGVPWESAWVAIYYMHGDASPTIFKTGRFKRRLIFPKKNRLIVFPNMLKHALYLPTKRNRRVINFSFLHRHPLLDK